MTPTLIMTKGLPGSGKSTWAKRFITISGGVRINKDDLRSMMHDGKWSKGNEKMVLAARDALVLAAMDRREKFIIVDDTNLASKHEARLRDLAGIGDYKFTIQDFTDVPLDECIRRNWLRPNPVPERVIRDMYNKFLKPEPPKIVRDRDLPDAIIVDVDGTLALRDPNVYGSTPRSPYDWHRVEEDTLNVPIAELVNYYESDFYHVIVMSGRDGVCYDETERWLKQNGVNYQQLLMRAPGDNRKDAIVKEELYREHIEGKFNVELVIDDRNQVVEMWRGLGLTCLQVADGDF